MEQLASPPGRTELLAKHPTPATADPCRATGEDLRTKAVSVRGPCARAWSIRERQDYGRRQVIKPCGLCVDNVSVSFDGFKAITDLTLILDKGELRCLIGPNGVPAKPR